MSDHPPKILYSTGDVAHALSVCRQTVLRLIAQGYLPAQRMGRTIRVHRKDVEALANAGLPSVWESDGKPWPDARAKKSA